MAEPRGLQRARADLEAGRVWKARDRLHGLVVGGSANQMVLELLGEVLWRMGDHPAAGRYWFLTEREGEDVNAAIAAMHERYGSHPGVLRSALPVKAPIEAYPESVQRRIRELDQSITYRGRAAARGTPLVRAREPSLWSRVRVALVLLVTVGVWCVGVVAVVILLAQAI